GGGGYALLWSDNAGRFIGGGLDARPANVEAKALGELRAYRVPVRPDAWALADEGEIDVNDHTATLFDPRRSVLEEYFRCYAAPALVRWWKMNADIAVGDRAEQRVGDCMHANIGVAVADEFPVIRDEHTAQDNRITG